MFGTIPVVGMQRFVSDVMFSLKMWFVLPDGPVLPEDVGGV